LLQNSVNSQQNCTFSLKTTGWTIITDELYTCEFLTDLPDANSIIQNVEGEHVDSKTKADVQIFSFANKELTFFPTSLINEFPALIGIKIDWTNLEYIGNNDLKDLPLLKYIGVTNSKLSYLPKNIFKDNVNLEIIDLKANPIVFIEGDVFATITVAGVKLVDFTGFTCALTLSTANEATFSELKAEITAGKCLEQATSVLETYVPRLRTELSKNYLLDEKNLLQQEEINELKVNASVLQSELDTLEGDLETCSSSLTTSQEGLGTCSSENDQCKKDLEQQIDLTKPVNGTCRFMNYNDIYSCVANNISIETAADQVKEWSGDHKEGKTAASILSLVIKDLNVKLLPRNVATTFTALNTLVVENTGLSSVTKADLTGYEKLVEISLTMNNLTVIEVGSLDGLVKLEVVILSQNRIQALPLKFFEKLTLLKHLDVSSNDITQLRYDLIPATNSIQKFYANGLYLKNIDYSLIYRLKKAAIIQFSGSSCNETKIETDTFISFFNLVLENC
jgi:Leucine-rich repeat (LRR) protein